MAFRGMRTPVCGAVLAGVLVMTVGPLAMTSTASAVEPAPFGHACKAQNGVRFCPTETARPARPDLRRRAARRRRDAAGERRRSVPDDRDDARLGGQQERTSSRARRQGNGNTTFDYNNVYYAQHGFAVLNYSARGWGRSCGSCGIARRDTPGCEKGWVHLADQRYEARDTQYLLGLLADEKIAKPNAIGVTGISYGGGQSIELAYLKNRIRLTNGEFAPWKSPKRKAMEVKAAYPRWPWSDLVDALTPNGRFLDTEIARTGPEPRTARRRDPELQLGAVRPRQGERLHRASGRRPRSRPHEMVRGDQRGRAGDARKTKKSPTKSTATTRATACPGRPAPLLLQNGWTDDLFPPKEALRVYNSGASPSKATVTLQFGDLGHSRGSNKENTDHAFQEQGASFFAARLERNGTAPASGAVTAYTQTCPQSARRRWAVHGQVVGDAAPPRDHRSAPRRAQTFTSAGGNPTIAAEFDPIAGTTDACKTVKAETEPNTANYTMTSPGFTLMGLPTVRATIKTLGPFGELARGYGM